MQICNFVLSLNQQQKVIEMKYDFYFSAKQAELNKEMSEIFNEPFYKCYINGIEYTEMCKQGNKPATNIESFPDFTKVCTDVKDNVKVFKISLNK